MMLRARVLASRGSASLRRYATATDGPVVVTSSSTPSSSGLARPATGLEARIGGKSRVASAKAGIGARYCHPSFSRSNDVREADGSCVFARARSIVGFLVGLVGAGGIGYYVVQQDFAHLSTGLLTDMQNLQQQVTEVRAAAPSMMPHDAGMLIQLDHSSDAQLYEQDGGD